MRALGAWLLAVVVVAGCTSRSDDAGDGCACSEARAGSATVACYCAAGGAGCEGLGAFLATWTKDCGAAASPGANLSRYEGCGLVTIYRVTSGHESWTFDADGGALVAASYSGDDPGYGCPSGQPDRPGEPQTYSLEVGATPTCATRTCTSPCGAPPSQTVCRELYDGGAAPSGDAGDP